MSAAHLLLAALLFRPCLAAEDVPDQAPSFSTDSIVNSANGSSTSLAPNVIATILGSNLAFTTESASVDPTTGGTLPNKLGGVQIRVANIIAPLLYVSPTQINFLIPAALLPGKYNLSVVRQSTAAQASITLLDVAPAIFLVDEGKPAAQHADGTLITKDAPAQPGEIIVVYGDGLGQTDPPQVDGVEPSVAAQILLLDRFRVLVDGQALPSTSVLYAGITPGYVGLYQINLRLPQVVTSAPELRFGFGDNMSQEGLRLPVVPKAP